MKNKIENMTIGKWNGIKNEETKQTECGYLWVSFSGDTTLMNVNPNTIGAKPTLYQQGACIGFKINDVSNKKQAIEKFKNSYQICH